MSQRFRPGCVLRSSLAFFGVIFLPFAGWFLVRDWRRYWQNSLGILVVSILLLWLAFDHSPDSVIAAVDDLDGPATPDSR